MRLNDDQVKLLRDFEELLTSEWVRSRTEKYIEEQKRPKKIGDKGRKFNSLVSSLGNVLPNLGNDSADEWQTLRLCAIASAVVNVANANCEGFEAKIEELKSNNATKIESTIYEFQVASHLLNLGHCVAFIPEDRSKRPDLLVDGCVEVECKQRGETDIERYQATIWEELYPRIVKIFLQKKYSATVEIFSSDQLVNRQEVSKIIKCLKTVGPGEHFDYSEGALNVTVRPVEILAEGTGIRANPPDPSFAATFEHVEMLFHQSDPVNTGFYLECRFGSLTLKGREDGVPSRLKSAKKQITGDKPAIAFIDLRFKTRDVTRVDFEPVVSVVDDWMRQNSTFAAVVITTPIENKIGGENLVGQHVIKRLHGAPKMSLPDGFTL